MIVLIDSSDISEARWLELLEPMRIKNKIKKIESRHQQREMRYKK